MHQIKVDHLITILRNSDQNIEHDFHLDVNTNFFKGKGHELLAEIFDSLGGNDYRLPLLDRLKFDFKINRFLFIYDDAVHFNRYRADNLGILD